MEKTYIGVDVSKDRLDVHILPDGQSFAVARDGEGLQELVDRLTALQPELIAVEATGGFERVVAAALAGACLPLVVANPAQMRHFAQALGRRAKTDPIDPKKVVLIAVARKLLTILNAILRDKQPLAPTKRLTSNTVAEERGARLEGRSRGARPAPPARPSFETRSFASLLKDEVGG